MKYRIKVGAHQEDGRRYATGEVVESHLNLTKLFPEKFAEVHDRDIPVSRGEPVKAERAPKVPKGLALPASDETPGGQPRGDETQLAGTKTKDTGLTQKAEGDLKPSSQTAQISKQAKKNAAKAEKKAGSKKWAEEEGK